MYCPLLIETPVQLLIGGIDILLRDVFLLYSLQIIPGIHTAY